MIFTSTISPQLKIGLRILGMLPDMQYTIFHRLICMSSILIVQCFQYLYLFAKCKLSDLQNLVDPLSVAIYYFLTIIKLIIFWANCRLIRDILAAVDTDWRECINIDQHLQLMKMKANKSQFCTAFLLIFNLIAAAIYFGSNNITVIIHLIKGINDTSRPFPLKLLFPSVAQQSPLYELLVILLFLQGLSIVYMVAILNALLSTLVIHATGQIDIIRQELKNMCVKVSYNGSLVFTIGMLIEKHNKVITFSKNIDKLFSSVAFLQVLSNTPVICLLALTGITSLHGENDAGLLKTIFAYIGVTTEIFIYCFVGEYFSNKSKSLADAGYESLWYNMSPNHSKKILFIIMRSQRQLTITAGGMLNLTIETFANIMKASASYVSVLYTMY